MADCGCGGSSSKKASARASRQPAPAPAVPREGGPQDRGSSYYSRAGRYTGPTKPKQ